jgi:hypothetical protein
METQTTQILEVMANDFGIEVNAFIALLMVVAIWQMIWKGIALWKSAELRQKWWFIAILVINTFGILEIIYIFFIAKKYKVEIEERNE